MEQRHSDFGRAMKVAEWSISPAAAAARESLQKAKGRGLNSIPVRFALMSAVFTTLCVIAGYFILFTGAQETSWMELVAGTVVLALVPAFITYCAASKLAGTIRQLRQSTEAIIAGDLNSPLDVDCACEVGGLADSFRAMVDRLNNNILRMNILAYSDPVTQLPNRAVVNHVLQIMSEAGCPATLMFIDLDGFKQVNDTLGHEAGDDVLREVSDRILEGGFGMTRHEIDTCTTTFGELCTKCPSALVFARFAGDEFVAILPEKVDRAEIETRAREIIAALRDPFIVNGTEVRLGASIGIARSPADTTDPELLLGYADLAMYAAKQAGKGRPRFFDDRLRQMAVDRAGIESGLRHAIENGQLELYYQPKLDARSHEVQGVEALVRWNHPEKGMIPPDAFIEIAESRGLMPDLGLAVMHLAVRQARKWMEADTPIPVAVNISAAQFERPHLVREILGVLEDYRVDPALLEIEITESMVMSDFAGTRYRLQQLQEAGVRISIDDFGTGFSNLSQLARLPFNVLKIDRSLVARLGKNEKSESIVGAIVHMAKALGHELVAEGIETPEQRDFLVELGCDRLQGHLFAPAMSLCELEQWCKQRKANPVHSMIDDVAACMMDRPQSRIVG
ncbi:MAG: EAL domain-containing protein [Sphingomonadaceae bacterium]